MQFISSKNRLVFTFTLLTMLAANTLHAGDALLLAPVSGENSKALNNVVTVAKKHGDFTDPVQAMASITDAGEENGYVVIIGPGVYQLTAQLDITPFIHVIGSGPDKTYLAASIDSASQDKSAAAIYMGNRTRLEGLSISNDANGGSFCTSIQIGAVGDNVSAVVENVSVSVEGCNSASGISTFASSSTFRQVSIIAAGQSSGIGINNTQSNAILYGSHIELSEASSNTGVRNQLSSSTIHNSTVSISSGNTAIAVNNTNSASAARIFNSRLSAQTSGTSTNVGQALSGADTPGVSQSYIVNSTLDGAVTGNAKCHFSFIVSGFSLTSTCEIFFPFPT